ncbi:MAG: hypothetical protein ACYCWE_19550 [Eubacteriales bacterium]
MSKKIVSLILCLLMLLPVFISCADESTGETTDTPGTTAETAAETDPRDIPDGLPERDYIGDTFTLFCREEVKEQYFVESENGEIVNDAIYARNLAVEERFHIKFDYAMMDGTWTNMVAFKNAIKSVVQAGDDSYDLIEGNCAISDLLGNGFFLNWNDMSFIDFSQPWWAQSSQRELNIGGSLEFIVGDYTLMLWEGLLVLYFNKQLVTDLNIDNPYHIVKDGKWTIDKLAEISREITQDLNGDSLFDSSDLYGLITTTGNCIDNFWISSDMPITVMDEDNFPVFNLPIQIDRALSVSEKVFNLVTGTGVYAIDEGKLADTLQPMFMADQGLFFTDFLDSSEVYRTMETDFGIIPYPKYDENQEKYETFSKTGYGTFAIPSVVSDGEMSAIITAALNAESYKKVVPAYYDVALKTKYSRDDESAEMLDIIRKGFDMDFACVCLDYTKWVFLEMRYMVQANNFNMASRIAKLEKQINSNLGKLKEDILSSQ